ncbi:calcium-binding protein [Kaistia algarum]|uniref:Tim44/TimA family putative adaptor protein n=1 Tax=Kaistia algarum TaxID=2083279 RepID=UPI000CE76357|nr:Tim44/TimA family putative adaptor protein [Kaistia algarum]MCX5513853.1 Tim44/TimA family putative adaptor protein [Kaistia algarum]PPE79288.1 calcium-binding protein [Kaistia algarum]
MSFDIYTLIFLVLAVVIFFKLRSVLGQRTGTERPSFDPFSRRNKNAEKPDDGKAIDAQPVGGAGQDGGNVVSLPRPEGAPAAVAADERIAAVATAGSPAAIGLGAILLADRNFDPGQFLDGARTAYELIVTAFARGDRKALKPLLGREVFDGFSNAIQQREQNGETVEFNFVGIEKAEIVDAAMKGSTAQVTVRFGSKLVSATRDKAGEVVEGDPVLVADVTDVWTFARDASSRDPNWALVATETVE